VNKLLPGLAILLLCACDDKVAGTNDETHTEVTARVFKPDGKTPAARASVKVVPADSVQAVAIGSVDSSGHPVTSTVPDGVYSVTFSLDGMVSTVDAVPAAGGRLNLATNDTLEPSGTLSGVLSMQPQDDPTTVVVQVLGTENYCNVNADGSFTMTGLPTGRVRLRLLTTLQNYTTTYDTAHATTGIDTRIRDTIRMVYTGIPVVTGLVARNDSATGQIRLSWNGARYAKLMDYLVFRDTAGAIGYSSQPFAATSDTFWTDTASDSIAKLQAWRYRVEVRNRQGVAGDWLGAVTAISVPPALRRYDSASWVQVGRGGSILGVLGAGRMASVALGAGGSTRTFSVRSSPDGVLWDSAGIGVPSLQLGQSIEWAAGIGAGKAWCIGNSATIADSVQFRSFDGTTWSAAKLPESIWPGTGAVLFGSAHRIALATTGGNPKVSWSLGDSVWHTVPLGGRILGVTDSGIYTDGGGTHLVLVSWADPSVKLRDLGVPPEPASRVFEWNSKPAFTGAHGLWVLDSDGWALRRSPSPTGVGSVNADLLLSDPSGNLWTGALK